MSDLETSLLKFAGQLRQHGYAGVTPQVLIVKQGSAGEPILVLANHLSNKDALELLAAAQAVLARAAS